MCCIIVTDVTSLTHVLHKEATLGIVVEIVAGDIVVVPSSSGFWILSMQEDSISTVTAATKSGSLDVVYLVLRYGAVVYTYQMDSMRYTSGVAAMMYIAADYRVVVNCSTPQCDSSAEPFNLQIPYH